MSDVFAILIILIIKIEASGSAKVKACDFKCDRLWNRFPVEEMEYFIFLFIRSGNETRSGVVFRRSALNASRIWCCLVMLNIPFLRVVKTTTAFTSHACIPEPR